MVVESTALSDVGAEVERLLEMDPEGDGVGDVELPALAEAEPEGEAAGNVANKVGDHNQKLCTKMMIQIKLCTTHCTLYFFCSSLSHCMYAIYVN